MKKMNLEGLEALLMTESPSSAEDEVSHFIETFNESICKIEKDAIGNTFMTFPDNNGPIVMIAAHCDEIGLQVVHVTEDGYIRFRPIGGVDIKTLAGRQVNILSASGKIHGVICKTPIHIELIEKNEKPVEWSDLWIDIGCSSREEAASLVSIGDIISFCPNYLHLNNSRIASKALDNKLGVFVALSAMKKLAGLSLTANNPVAVFTVQEEIGCKGASIAAHALRPSWCICIDVGVASDCPGISVEKYGRLVLGEGPGLSYNTDICRPLTDQAAMILREEGIPFQKTTGLSATGGTDTMRIQVAGNGIPCILLSIPLRGMHTAAEVCDMKDISITVDAVVALVKKIHYENSLSDRKRPLWI